MLYHVYSRIDDKGVSDRLFRRDSSFRPVRQGALRSGIRVVDTLTAAEANARKIARGYGKGAEALIAPRGLMTNGGLSFFVEIWTRQRSRLVATMVFAIATK